MTKPPLQIYSSNFYKNFSIGELINSNTTRFGILCANGSTGGIGTETTFQNIDKNFVVFNSHHSSSAYLQPFDSVNFDYLEFINSIVKQIAEEIVLSGAKVIDRDFAKPTDFAFQYSDLLANGEIKIKMILNADGELNIDVYLVENSSRTDLPEKATRPLFKPEGRYYVGAFNASETLKFQKQWQSAREFGDAKLRRKMLAPDFSKNDLRQSVVYQLRSIESLPVHLQSSEAKDHLESQTLQKYRKFYRVFFFNETLRELFEEANIHLSITESISSEEINELSLKPHLRFY